MVQRRTILQLSASPRSVAGSTQTFTTINKSPSLVVEHWIYLIEFLVFIFQDQRDIPSCKTNSISISYLLVNSLNVKHFYWSRWYDLSDVTTPGLGAMAMKGYSTFPNAQALLEPHPQIVLCHIQDTRWCSLTSLLRSSECILQPQLTGLQCF